MELSPSRLLMLHGQTETSDIDSPPATCRFRPAPLESYERLGGTDFARVPRPNSLDI